MSDEAIAQAITTHFSNFSDSLVSIQIPPFVFSKIKNFSIERDDRCLRPGPMTVTIHYENGIETQHFLRMKEIDKPL